MIRKRNFDEIPENNQKPETSEANKPPKFTDIQIKTFKEESIEILNILDSQGINIYDESNYPGMYLKQKSNKNSKISNFFSSQKDNEKNKSNENQEKIKNLFDFFNQEK